MDARPATGALAQRCPAGEGRATVLVAIRHPAMRRGTAELLAAEPGCWNAVEPYPAELLVDAIARTRPDVVVVDSVDFPACCRAALDGLSPHRVIVIGPEPDAAYRSWALGQGAGGWVSRDQIGDDLTAAMRAALGGLHWCSPPSPTRRAVTAGDSLPSPS